MTVTTKLWFNLYGLEDSDYIEKEKMIKFASNVPKSSIVHSNDTIVIKCQKLIQKYKHFIKEENKTYLTSSSFFVDLCVYLCAVCTYISPDIWNFCKC